MKALVKTRNSRIIGSCVNGKFVVNRYTDTSCTNILVVQISSSLDELYATVLKTGMSKKEKLTVMQWISSVKGGV
jgi:hypothetical protein